MKFRLLLSAALATALIAPNAFACGDSLYRVGKGVLYRTYTTPLPGNLLIFAQTADAHDMARMLEEAGHSVQVVTDSSQFEARMLDDDFDVVLAPFSELAGKAGAAAHKDWLPVAASDEEARLARQQFAVVLQADDDIRFFLKTIHKSLKSRA